MPQLEKFYWNDRYIRGSDSGYGSYGEQLQKKLDWLRQLPDVTSVTEIGCGDFNFGKSLMDQYSLDPSVYNGFDISDVIIGKNKKRYPQYNFHVLEGGVDIPEADLLLCVDVLFHIYSDEECEKLLRSLGELWKKYLVLTAYERDEEMHGHVRIRKFNPFRFGEPILREVVEEDGSLYFYIFKK